MIGRRTRMDTRQHSGESTESEKSTTKPKTTRLSLSERMLALSQPTLKVTTPVESSLTMPMPASSPSPRNVKSLQRRSASSLTLPTHVAQPKPTPPPAQERSSAPERSAPSKLGRHSVSAFPEKDERAVSTPRQRLSMTRSNATPATLQRGGSARDLRTSRMSQPAAPAKLSIHSDLPSNHKPKPMPPPSSPRQNTNFNYIPAELNQELSELRDELSRVQAQLQTEREAREALEIDNEHLRLENEILSVRLQSASKQQTGAPSGSVDTSLRLDQLESVLLDMLIKIEGAKATGAKLLHTSSEIS